MATGNPSNALLNFRAENITLDNWVEGINSELLSRLRALVAPAGDATDKTGNADKEDKPQLHHIWTAAGGGKTTLLRAVYTDAKRNGKSAYLIAANSDSRGDTMPPFGDGLLIVDDIQLLSDTAQLSLYDWVNRGNPILTAADAAPGKLPLDLALASRLSGGLVFNLRPLSDDDKKHALALWARRRGFALDADISALLLTRLPRDMHNLTSALGNLDNFLLRNQKPLTLARARRWLGEFSAGAETTAAATAAASNETKAANETRVTETLQ